MSFWMDYGPMLSHNKLFNYAIGEKGCGKTYGATKLVLSQFLKTGKQFIWMRRYESELKTWKSLFTKLQANGEFEDVVVKPTREREYKVNGELAGKPIALSKAITEKGFGEFTKPGWIIFDEFIITSKNYHYISNEVTQFLDLYETICRFNDARVIFIGNSASLLNPYFTYFGLVPDTRKKFTFGNDSVIEWCFNEEYRAAKKESRFGKLVAGTAYESFAVENNPLQDETTFIEKRTVRADCRFGIRWRDRTWYFWINYNAGKGWLEEKGDTDNIYALTLEDHSFNTLLLSRAKKDYYYRIMLECLYAGGLRFSCLQAKKDFEEIWRLVG